MTIMPPEALNNRLSPPWPDAEGKAASGRPLVLIGAALVMVLFASPACATETDSDTNAGYVISFSPTVTQQVQAPEETGDSGKSLSPGLFLLALMASLYFSSIDRRWQPRT